MKKLTPQEISANHGSLYVPCDTHAKWHNTCVDCLASSVWEHAKLLTKYEVMLMEDTPEKVKAPIRYWVNKPCNYCGHKDSEHIINETKLRTAFETDFTFGCTVGECPCEAFIP